MTRVSFDHGSQPSSFRLVDSGWAAELIDGVREGAGELRIVCPFIKERALDRLLELGPKNIRVITRFKLADFADGVSDIAALRKLLRAGAAVRGIRNLHAKLYLFGERRAIVTSANLTEAGLCHNPEFGVVTNDPVAIGECRAYFDRLWPCAGNNLRLEQLRAWDQEVTQHQLVSGYRTQTTAKLGDCGVDAGLVEPKRDLTTTIFGDAPQAFIKFLGDGSNRAPLSLAILKEIEESGCHRAVGYPVNKRPRSVKNGAEMFISRLVEGDTRVFGRAVAVKYEPSRDDATPKDIELRPWRSKWPHYIRVHHAEFVAGTMANGVSLGELMNTLKANSFAPTQRNAASGDGSNTSPRRSIRRQAAAELTDEAYAWLSQRLQKEFEAHSKILESELCKLDQPELPADWRTEQGD